MKRWDTPEEYEAQWLDMLRSLVSDFRVRVDRFERGEPATDSEIGALRGFFPGPLPDGLEGFLRWSNGCALAWSVWDEDEQYWVVGGNWEFSSTEEIITKAWNGSLDLLSYPLSSYGLSFDSLEEAGAIPFDYFTSDPGINIEASVFIPRLSNAVMVSEDNCCFPGSYLLSFREYVSLVFATLGAPGARLAFNLYFDRGSPYARDYWPQMFSRAYSLDALIQLALHFPNVEENREFFGRSGRGGV